MIELRADAEERELLKQDLDRVADALYMMQMMDNSFYEDEATEALRRLEQVYATLGIPLEA